jgi:hypothetical protein
MAHKKYKVNYRPDNELETYNITCKFCLRQVYFDSQHVNDKGVPVPHDRPISEYRDLNRVPHHADHCPDLTGDSKAKLYYKKLRDEAGRPDPYYKTEINVSKDEVTVNQELRDPDLHKGDDRYSTTKLNDIVREQERVARPITQEDIDKIQEDLKTLEVKFEVFTASFNDYVNITMKAIKGFLEDVHNNMTDKERIEARAESLIDSTKKIVTTGDKIMNGSLDLKIDTATAKSLERYFAEPTDDSQNTT